MKSLVLFLLAMCLLYGCTNLPSAGWYQQNFTGEKVYALYVGEEADIKAKYPGAFEKQQFIIALAQSPSAQYLTAGRPRYYTVLGEAPDSKTKLRLITLELLERDYQRK